MSGASWQWSSADSASGTFTNISGGTADAYTTVAADIGKYLKATVSYTDGHGSGKSADATTGDAVSRRLPGSEFDTLDAAGNDNPRGIWSNRTTVWVSDFDDDKLFAYKLSDKSRDSGEDFSMGSSNNYPNAIWSDETTMWVTDSAGDKLFAYKMSDKSRDSGEDFDTLEAAGNDDPRGLWSDGTTMWVTDTEDKEIYAYKMSDKSRDSGKDFDTLDAAGNDKPRGIWSDGTTMWVADDDDDKIYAYKMSDKSRDSGKEFDLHSENTVPYGIWSDLDTLWVVDNEDDKLYAYYVSDLAVNTALSGIEVNGTSIPGFVPGDTEPQYGVASTVSDAAIVATAQAASATVSYGGTDADSNTTAHDISLSDGANTVTITVTDKGESAEYTLGVNRAVTDRYGWKADSDFDTLKLNGIRTPRGIWSDGTEVWVLDTDDRKVYAYNTDRTRLSTEDFSIGGFSNGIWGNGTTLWAASSASDKLFAYSLGTGASDSGKDFDTLDAAGNESPRGVWSDETTMWVSDSDDGKVYAYKMSDKSRDSGKDFDTLDAAGNDDPRGIWSDETTMWVADGGDGKVYAYKMSDMSRDSGKDFDTLDDAGNDDPKGMWSDGTTLWVTDDQDDKVYAYNLMTEDIPGVARMSTENPVVGELITAGVVDADGVIGTLSLQWSSASNATGPFANIPGETSQTYTPVTGDIGKFLKVTVSYDDGHGPGKSAEKVTGSAVVAAAIVNSQPEFDSSEDGRRSVAENDSGASVGSPLAATDGNSDTLYFDLSGPDASSFDIGGNSGQLSLKSGVSLNYEDEDSYSFEVTVSDRKDANGDADTEVDDTLSVTVSVSNVDEDGSVTLSTYSPRKDSEVTASLSDPDGSVSGTSWQWSRANSINGAYSNISGATSSAYTPDDDDVDKFLRARVTYTDGHGSGKNASRKSTNAVSEEASVDRGGVVTLSARNPAVGVKVMATLLELDTPTSSESWQWSGSSSRTGTFTPISGANSSAYTPVTGDVGKYLKAKVEYTDSHGPNKSAEAVTVNAVAPEPETMENRPSKIWAYWDVPGHYDGNIMADCAGTVPFSAYWERPKRADEWEAEVTPEYGASNLSRDPIGYIGDGFHELTGTVHIRDGEFSVVSIRVRGRFGEDGWGAWSPVTELFCNPP